MKAKRRSGIKRNACIFGIIVATILIGYVFTYVCFKSESGDQYLGDAPTNDPWVDGSNMYQMARIFTLSGDFYSDNGSYTREEYRLTNYSINPKLAQLLDSFYFPAKRIDQRLTGSEVSFFKEPFLRAAENIREVRNAGGVVIKVVVGGEEIGGVGGDEFTIDLSLDTFPPVRSE